MCSASYHKLPGSASSLAEDGTWMSQVRLSVRWLSEGNTGTDSTLYVDLTPETGLSLTVRAMNTTLQQNFRLNGTSRPNICTSYKQIILLQLCCSKFSSLTDSVGSKWLTAVDNQLWLTVWTSNVIPRTQCNTGQTTSVRGECEISTNVI